MSFRLGKVKKYHLALLVTICIKNMINGDDDVSIIYLKDDDVSINQCYSKK